MRVSVLDTVPHDPSSVASDQMSQHILSLDEAQDAVDLLDIASSTAARQAITLIYDAELRGDLHDVLSLSNARFAVQRCALTDLHQRGMRLPVSHTQFLVVLFGVRMASDLMSQHLRVILSLAEALHAVSSHCPILWSEGRSHDQTQKVFTTPASTCQHGMRKYASKVKRFRASVLSCKQRIT